MDKFEYVMHGATRGVTYLAGFCVDDSTAGKVFKIGEDRSSTPAKVEVHASFGGLLMLLKVLALRQRWLALH